MWQYNCQTSSYQVDYARQAMQQQAMQSSQRQHQQYLDNVRAYQDKQRAEENYRSGIGLTDSQRIERDNQIKEAAEKKAKEEKDRVYWDDWNKKQNQEAYARELKRKSIEAAQKRENEKLMLEQESKRIEQKRQEQETKKQELEKQEQDKKKLEVEKREQKLQKNTNNHGKCKPNNKNTESMPDSKTNECCDTCNIL